MRVRHLQTFVQNERLFNWSHLNAIHGSRMGIDTTAWIRGLHDLKDPYGDIMGGLPINISAVIGKQLENFERADLFPVFLIQGLTPHGHSLFNKVDSKIVKEAWQKLINGDAESAFQHFCKSLSRLTEESITYIQRYLRKHKYKSVQINGTNISSSSELTEVKISRLAVIGCPYLCASQMLYMARHKLLDIVYGMTSYVLMGFDQVVTGIDFFKQRCEWVSRQDLLKAWDVTPRQLADACLLAGNEYCHTLPHANVQKTQLNFEMSILLAKHGSLQQYLQFFPDPPIEHEFRHLYSLSRALVTFLVALQHDGKVTPFTVESLAAATVPPLSPLLSPSHGSSAGSTQSQVPATTASKTNCQTPVPLDFHKVGGWRLPNTISAMMMHGLISPTLPRALSYGEWRDNDSPLILTHEYDKLLKSLRGYRLLALGLIARHLHPCFHNRKIIFKYVNRLCKDPLVLLTSIVSPDLENSQYKPNRRPFLNWSFTADDLSKRLSRMAPGPQPLTDISQQPSLSEDNVTPGYLFCLNWYLSSTAQVVNSLMANCQNFVPFDNTGGSIISNSPAFEKIEELDVYQSSEQSLKNIQNYILAQLYFNVLDALDYFSLNGEIGLGNQENNSTSQLTTFAVLASTIGRDCKFETELILAIELLKFGLLTGVKFNYAADNEYLPELVNPPTDHMKNARLRLQSQLSISSASVKMDQDFSILFRLISRVASLVPIELDHNMRQCPQTYLDFDIGAFQSLVRMVKRELNHIVEGCIAHMIFSQPKTFSLLTPDLFDPDRPRIPWFQLVLGCGGVLISNFMTTDFKEDGMNGFLRLQTKFPEITNLAKSLLDICEFWSIIYLIARPQLLCQNTELADQFEQANALLMLQLSNFLNFSKSAPQPQYDMTDYSACRTELEHVLGLSY